MIFAFTYAEAACKLNTSPHVQLLSSLAADEHHPLLRLLALLRRLLLQLLSCFETLRLETKCLIAVDHVEDVHELPLVLVDALDLDVDQGVLTQNSPET